MDATAAIEPTKRRILQNQGNVAKCKSSAQLNLEKTNRRLRKQQERQRDRSRKEHRTLKQSMTSAIDPVTRVIELQRYLQWCIEQADR